MFLLAHIAAGPLLAESTAVRDDACLDGDGRRTRYGSVRSFTPRVVGAAAYVAACDVLWRVTEAKYFYEGGSTSLAPSYCSA